MIFDWEGETLHYVLEGEGPGLLLVHGLGGNGGNWLIQRHHFSASHRVLTLDLPGHGRSTGRSVPSADYWRAAEAALDHANIGRTALCGLAVGARTGLALAARRPDRVAGLVIVNAVLHLEPDDHTKRLALYDLLLEAGGGKLWAEQMLPLMGVLEHPAIVRGFRRSIEQIDPLHIRRVFLEQDSWDQRPELEKITCPTLVVRGAKDDLVPAYCAEEIRSGVPESELIVMDAGHLPYLETPASFNFRLSEFLSRKRI